MRRSSHCDPGASNLERLAQEGLIERVHGGARTPGTRPRRLRVATDWAKRLQQAVAEKDAIAARAAEFVEDGSTIFLDSSTTCLALARLFFFFSVRAASRCWSSQLSSAPPNG